MRKKWFFRYANPRLYMMMILLRSSLRGKHQEVSARSPVPHHLPCCTQSLVIEQDAHLPGGFESFPCFGKKSDISSCKVVRKRSRSLSWLAHYVRWSCDLTLRIVSMLRNDRPNGLTSASHQSQMPVIRPVSRSTWISFSRRSMWLGQSAVKRGGRRSSTRCIVSRKRSGSPSCNLRSCVVYGSRRASASSRGRSNGRFFHAEAKNLCSCSVYFCSP